MAAKRPSVCSAATAPASAALAFGGRSGSGAARRAGASRTATGCSCNPRGGSEPDRRCDAPNNGRCFCHRYAGRDCSPLRPGLHDCCVSANGQRTVECAVLPGGQRAVRREGAGRLATADRQVSLPSPVRGGAHCDSCRSATWNFPLGEPLACDTSRLVSVRPKFPIGLVHSELLPNLHLASPYAVGPAGLAHANRLPGTVSSDNPGWAESWATARLKAWPAEPGADCELETWGDTSGHAIRQSGHDTNQTPSGTNQMAIITAALKRPVHRAPRCQLHLQAAGCGLRLLPACPSGSRDLAARRWLGCLPCGCDTAGSLPNCVAAPDGVGSVCACLNDSVAGRLCDRPASEHFWPGLGQHRIELETSARIPSSPADAPNGANGTAPQLRYAFNATEFPGFSYLGYVPLDKPQPAVELELATVSQGRGRSASPSATWRPASSPPAPTTPPPASPCVCPRSAAGSWPACPSELRQCRRRSTATVELPDAGNLTLRLELADPDGRLAQEALLIDWLELTPAELLTGQACAAISRRPAAVQPPTTSLSPQRAAVSDGGLGSRPGAERYPPWGRFLLLDFVSDGPGGHTVVLRVGDNSLEFQLPACPNSKPCRHPAKRRRAPDLPAELALKAADTEIRLQLLSGPGLSLRAVYTIPLSRWSPRLLESRIARYRLPDIAGTGRPAPPSLRPGRRRRQLPASRAQSPMAGSRRLRRLRLGSRWSCRRARRPSVSGLLTRPTPLPHSLPRLRHGAPERLRLCRQAAGAQRHPDGPKTEPVRSSVALQFCAAEAGCPVDIGEMLRLPGINELYRHRHPFEVLRLPYNFGGHRCRKALSRLGATFRQDCLLADELEVRRSDPLCSRCLQQASVTYNKGYRPCQCHPQGALNKTCDPLSGQCSCRRHHGWPHLRPMPHRLLQLPGVQDCGCQMKLWVQRNSTGCILNFDTYRLTAAECDCPGGLLCSEPDGECICPRNVAGKKCDRCEPGNYGYNVVTGCMVRGGAAAGDAKGGADAGPAAATRFGTTNGLGTCDLVTGQCSCGENIAGQKCSHCKRGHFAFPSCEKCNCTSEGVTEEICSAESGACACKRLFWSFNFFENPDFLGKRGPATCSRCKAGFFNLDPANSFGLPPPASAAACECTCTEAAARMVTPPVTRTASTPAPQQSVKRLVQPLPSGSSAPSQQLNDQLRQLGEPADPRGAADQRDGAAVSGPPAAFHALEFDGAPAAAELDSFLTLWTNQGGSLRHRIMQAGRTPARSSESRAAAAREFVHQPERVGDVPPAVPKLPGRMRRISWPMAVVGNVRRSVTSCILFATARLQDASLELAEVSDASSAAGRPVRGVERCACPKEFSGLSCQLPRSRLLHRYQRRPPT
uniref:Laminin EGF-like domain-containing protein n=1 Tax=Macrostomum lignano TaxID=282301 RepID=A0A1I8JS04_9PLAT